MCRTAAGPEPRRELPEVLDREDPRRRILLELFGAALGAVEGRRCTREALSARAARDDPREERRRCWAIAIGKAASRMMLGARDALGPALERGLVITKDGHLDPEILALEGLETRECGHPLPDERSLAAGERVLAFLEEMPADVQPLCLISGGASSLVEVLAPGAGYADLERLNTEGLARGLPIGELNRRRGRISCLKAGRLAARLRGQRALALFISDVPGDDPAVIGSGLLGPAPRPAGGAGERGGATGRAGGTDDVERIVIASVTEALQAVRARSAGLAAQAAPERFDGDASELAVRFSHELALGTAQLRAWGGESVLELPAHPGHGGRNQHLALACARLIAGREDLCLLAAGTDGTDGPTPDAGGLVDGETCARIACAGLDVDDCLRRASSGEALAAAGDLVHTGPTGTNVGDLVLGLKLPPRAAREWLAAGGSRQP